MKHTVIETNPYEREMIFAVIDDAMVKKDRYVSIFFGPHGTTVSVYPITEDDEE